MNASRPVTTSFRRVLSVLSNCDGNVRGVGLLVACGVLLLPELGGDVGRALLRYDRATWRQASGGAC